MNRERIKRLYILNETKAAGFSLEQRASAFADRFEYALEEEIQEREIGAVDLDALRPEPVRQVPSPDPDSSFKSMIVMPGSAEANQVDIRQKIRPIMPSRAQAQDPSDGKKYRTMQRLTEDLYKMTPDRMEVIPEGRTEPVVLKRNIVQGIGMDAVKLMYELGNMEHSRPSVLNADLSVTNSTMSLDTPVVDTFFCTERDLNIDERLDKMRAQARVVFKPRPGSITPVVRNENFLRIGGDTPYANTDSMGIDRHGIGG